MANREHLNILKKGVDAWNAWRERAHGLIPDLAEADLVDAELRVVDFGGRTFAERASSMRILTARFSPGQSQQREIGRC